MKLHPDAPDMPWSEARIVMGIMDSIYAMVQAAKEAATIAAEESGTLAAVPTMVPGRLRVEIYRRVFRGGIRTCWRIEHAVGDQDAAERLHDHLVVHHACYLSPREAASIARPGGNIVKLPCGCCAYSPIDRSVRVHKRVRFDALTLRR